jgi:hypothetical protein
MKVLFSDSFTESLERLIERERWYYKTWDFIRYDFPRFIKNIWFFRKALFSYRWWDSHSFFYFMEPILKEKADLFEKKGLEVIVPRSKKVAKMRRAAEIVGYFMHDSFIELAEKDLGLKYEIGDLEFEEAEEKDTYTMAENRTEEEIKNNKLVSERAKEIEASLWKELWEIMRGQDYTEFAKELENVETIGKRDDLWESWFDGSDCRSWWD